MLTAWDPRAVRGDRRPRGARLPGATRGRTTQGRPVTGAARPQADPGDAPAQGICTFHHDTPGRPVRGWGSAQQAMGLDEGWGAGDGGAWCGRDFRGRREEPEVPPGLCAPTCPNARKWPRGASGQAVSAQPAGPLVATFPRDTTLGSPQKRKRTPRGTLTSGAFLVPPPPRARACVPGAPRDRTGDVRQLWLHPS